MQASIKQDLKALITLAAWGTSYLVICFGAALIATGAINLIALALIATF